MFDLNKPKVHVQFDESMQDVIIDISRYTENHTIEFMRTSLDRSELIGLHSQLGYIVKNLQG